MMPFELTHDQIKHRETLAQNLEKAGNALESEIIEFNRQLRAMRNTIQKRIDDYNSVLKDVSEFAAEIVSEAEAEFDQTTQTWQESDGGECAQAWIDYWSGHDPDQLELTLPEDMDEFCLNDAKELRELPAASSECVE